MTKHTTLKTFKELGVSANLIQGLEGLGITTPTAIQLEAIPFLLQNGGDLIAQAQTGTGKTAAFGLPLLEKIDPKLKEIQALVVAPTRELAKQIGKQLFRFTKFTEKIFIEVLTGGDSMDRQKAALQRPTHIIVVTPGRLADLLKHRALHISNVKYLVLDEADEMLSLGFKKELEQFFTLTKPKRRATWLFSATIPDGIRHLITDYMAPTAHSLKIDKAHVVNRDISHQFVVVGKGEKLDAIADFLERQKGERGVIFCRMIAGAINLSKELTARGFSVGVLHGDLMQFERDKVLRSFKKERHQFLIATDVAARGIDVEGLSFVLHHQLPDQIQYYTHRSGRTARAGKKGISIAFIDAREKHDITALSNELGINFREVR